MAVSTVLNLKSALTSLAIAGSLFVASAASAQGQLPAHLANDPVAKALGPEVMNAALKEGSLIWYGSVVPQEFLQDGGRERFEKRFGIKVNGVFAPLRNVVDRIRTEVSVGKVVADIFDGNDQYMLELYDMGALMKWRAPAPELNRINKQAFVAEPEGYWSPVYLSAQGIIVNTRLADPSQIKSYWDLVDPKFAGKVGIRDPRASSGGAWHMLNIYEQPGLGLDYIEKFASTTKPVIIGGAADAMRDAVVRGQFAIGFSGRGENFRDLPKGHPLAWVVPREGLAWTPSSIAILKDAPRPNAAKVMLTWLYETPQLQLWTDTGRPVPHPDMKLPVPEMDVSSVPLMVRIPDQHLAQPNFFFKAMEKVFGVR
jgi:iron(III) transport system substrate-binding protein